MLYYMISLISKNEAIDSMQIANLLENNETL